MNKYEIIKHKIEELTKKSSLKEDYNHSQEVLKWALKLKPDASDSLKIAALGHDIDRCFPERKAKREDFVDYKDYKKKHSFISAEIISEMMKEEGFENSMIDNVKSLIELHEVGGAGEAEVLNDADLLTFFTYDIEEYAKSPHYSNFLKAKIIFSYERASIKSKKIIKGLSFNDKNTEKVVRESILEIDSNK